MPPTAPSVCPDCEGKLQLVQLRLAARPDVSAESVQLQFNNARFDVGGTVRAFRCDACTRIFLYG